MALVKYRTLGLPAAGCSGRGCWLGTCLGGLCDLRGVIRGVGALRCRAGEKSGSSARLLRGWLYGACLWALCAQSPSAADQGLDSAPQTDGPSSVAQEMARHQSDLGRLEDHLQLLRQELLDGERYRTALFAELEKSERDIAALARAGHELSKMVEEQQHRVDLLSTRLAETRADLERARTALAQMLRSAYQMGRGDRLRMLLNQDDLGRGARLFGYYQCIGRERAERITEVERLASELDRLRTESAEQALRLDRLAKHQEQTRLRLQVTHRSRAPILSSLEETLAERRDQVIAMDRDAEALRALIESLRKQVEISDEIELTQEDIASLKGRLQWPVTAPDLLSGFRGADLEPGDLHADGVVIATETGSEVHAIHHGRVIYADWLRGFGMLLVLDHGDGYMSLYGHNQTLLTEVGEWVGADEVVALTGSSGGSSNQGLYFAIRRDGRPMNPEHWCSRGEE